MQELAPLFLVSLGWGIWEGEREGRGGGILGEWNEGPLVDYQVRLGRPSFWDEFCRFGEIPLVFAIIHELAPPPHPPTLYLTLWGKKGKKGEKKPVIMAQWLIRTATFPGT